MKSKILAGLLSLVVACSLWLYVVTVVSPGSEKTINNVPVSVQGDGALADRELCITNNLSVVTVDLHLAGNRIDLDKLNNTNITVYVDVSNITEPGEYERSYSITYPPEVTSNSITVQTRNPGTVKVVVEQRMTKKVPVNVQVGLPDDGYVANVEDMEYPEDIWVKGPERIVSKIASAEVEIDLTGQHTRIEMNMPYQLYDEAGNPLSEEEMALITDDQEHAGTVPVNLRVALKKTIAVKARIIPGGGASEKDVEITYSVEEITVSGNLQPLLEGQTVLPDIDLSKLTEQTNTFTLKITLPDDVVCESGETEVEVTVVFKDLRTTELLISNFEIEGVPEGMEATINTKSLKVMFRGTKAAVEALRTSQVRAVVSFVDGKPGTIDREVIITLVDEENNQVGVVGTYSVNATLKEAGATENS